MVLGLSSPLLAQVLSDAVADDVQFYLPLPLCILCCLISGTLRLGWETIFSFLKLKRQKSKSLNDLDYPAVFLGGPT